MMEYTESASLSMNKLFTLERLVYKGSVTISFLSVFYILSVFVTGASWFPLVRIDANSSELTLSLAQCLLGAVVLHIPKLITKITRIQMPDVLSVCFYIFILCSTILGELFSLYYAVPFWDAILHLSSGIMAGILGSILIVNYCQEKESSGFISPIFIAGAVVCFAICIGVFWEIYEFIVDSLLGLNMQKFLLQDGTELMGQAALADTMKDLIMDLTGAMVAVISSFMSLKCKKRMALFPHR